MKNPRLNFLSDVLVAAIVLSALVTSTFSVSAVAVADDVRAAANTCVNA